MVVAGDAGAVDLAQRTAEALNKGGKVPMFSNPASFVNGPKPAPIWLNESRLVNALQDTTCAPQTILVKRELLRRVLAPLFLKVS